MHAILRIIALCGTLLMAACSGVPEGFGEDKPSEIAGLTTEIMNLGPGIDPEEAARAAEIAILYPGVLAREYEIEDPPLMHNFKVNRGLKPRGLCKHWAEDMQVRLRQENFRTLELHRAIANADNPLLIDHSTVIIGRKGDAWDDGIVLDPWRYGGPLFWAKVSEDDRYPWRNRVDVFAERREWQASRGAAAEY